METVIVAPKVLYEILCHRPKYSKWRLELLRDKEEWAKNAARALALNDHLSQVQKSRTEETEEISDEELKRTLRSRFRDRTKVATSLKQVPQVPEKLPPISRATPYSTKSGHKKPKKVNEDGEDATRKRKRDGTIEAVDLLPSSAMTTPLAQQPNYVTRKSSQQHVLAVEKKMYDCLFFNTAGTSPQNLTLFIDWLKQVKLPRNRPVLEARRARFSHVVTHDRKYEQQMLRTVIPGSGERQCCLRSGCRAVVHGGKEPCVEYMEPDVYARAMSEKVFPVDVGMCLRDIRYAVEEYIQTIRQTGHDPGEVLVCQFENECGPNGYDIFDCTFTTEEEFNCLPYPVVRDIPEYYTPVVENGVTWYIQDGYVSPPVVQVQRLFV